MANHTFTVIKTSQLEIDSILFGDSVTGVTFDFETEELTRTPISGNVQKQIGAPSATMTINFDQSFVTGELTHYLWTNYGQTKTVRFLIDGDDSAPVIEASVVLALPNSLGGDVGVPSTSATFGVNGMPDIDWALAS